jgi:hypothetical protein
LLDQKGSVLDSESNQSEPWFSAILMGKNKPGLENYPKFQHLITTKKVQQYDNTVFLRNNLGK